MLPNALKLATAGMLGTVLYAYLFLAGLKAHKNERQNVGQLR